MSNPAAFVNWIPLVFAAVARQPDYDPTWWEIVLLIFWLGSFRIIFRRLIRDPARLFESTVVVAALVALTSTLIIWRKQIFGADYFSPKETVTAVAEGKPVPTTQRVFAPDIAKLQLEAQAEFESLDTERKHLDPKNQEAISAFNKKAAAYQQLLSKIKSLSRPSMNKSPNLSER